jgi:hypothetical protein
LKRNKKRRRRSGRRKRKRKKKLSCLCPSQHSPKNDLRDLITGFPPESILLKLSKEREEPKHLD